MGLGPVQSHHPPSSIRPHQLPLPSGPVGFPPPGAPLLATRSPVPTYQQFRRYIIYNDPENTTSSPSDCLDSDDLMRNMRKNLETLLEKKEYMKTAAAHNPDYEKIMKEMNSVIDKQYDEIWNRLFQRHNL
ncbi:hypothetical protein BGZ97_004373 [Linnemannia gamsii]|jgi:hypothetical protein|uniref:Uncharacterized protein n=1 Tax=Linnemannia gamsii TaxID=64522 RepID=A0A9P6QTA8_9FUNG|nr:hypothetical protein BGZ97_004373 [Linnemannia gamsii]